MQDPVVDKIIAHVARAAAGELPEAARTAAKTFVADSLGVGIAGAGAPWRSEVLNTAMAAGGAPEAMVWGTGERLPLAAAAMVNGYQMHALEFDCVHEGAVVHAMSAVLPCLVGSAERDGGIPGDRLLRAVVAGVDVAVMARSPHPNPPPQAREGVRHVLPYPLPHCGRGGTGRDRGRWVRVVGAN